jgi:hypothetical protein
MEAGIADCLLACLFFSFLFACVLACSDRKEGRMRREEEELNAAQNNQHIHRCYHEKGWILTILRYPATMLLLLLFLLLTHASLFLLSLLYLKKIQKALWSYSSCFLLRFRKQRGSCPAHSRLQCSTNRLDQLHALK